VWIYGRMKLRAIILPGNGNCDIASQWYLWVKKKLEAIEIKVIVENMPDADLARKKYWLPWIKKKSKGADKIILIGHSSGAIAVLRYVENNAVEGIVLVAASHTDLGNETEKASGYFNEPWQWNKIKQNVRWIIQFASTDDPYIPIKEARFIHAKIKSEYYEYTNQKHFCLSNTIYFSGSKRMIRNSLRGDIFPQMSWLYGPVFIV